MTVAYLQPKHAQRTTSILAGKRRNPKGAEHINALVRRWQDHQDIAARNEIIERNLRFIATVAKQCQGALTFEEAVDEGCLGMIEACGRFDPARGFKFISYAVHWVRQAIKAAQPEHGHIIRQPAHLISLKVNLGKRSERLGQRHHRTATSDEAEEDMELTPGQRQDLKAFTAMHASLDLEIAGGEKDKRTLADTIPAPTEDQDDDLALVLSLLHTLPPREEMILRRHFGIGQEHRETLEAIGATIGITRERVRQLEGQALKDLKTRLAQMGVESTRTRCLE